MKYSSDLLTIKKVNKKGVNMAGKQVSWKEELLASLVKDEAEQVRLQGVQVVSTTEALVFAIARTRAADVQQEIADEAYVPAFLDVDRYRDWEVEEDIAKAARRKARTAAWEATRKFLALNKK
jgi:hypothetical protein